MLIQLKNVLRNIIALNDNRKCYKSYNNEKLS